MKTRIWGILMAAILVVNGLFSNGAMIMANAAAEDFSVTLDGDSSEWDYIKKIQVDTGGFAQVAAFRTEDSLYIMREMADMSQYTQDEVFIDVDGDSSNNYDGLDYLIQGGNMYAYKGPSGWEWDTAHSLPFERKFNSDNSVGEYKIPLSSLSNLVEGATIKVKVTTTHNWVTIFSSSLAGVGMLEEVYQNDGSTPISAVNFTPNGELKAITDATMEGGTVGTLSATGGTGSFTYAFAVSDAYGPDNDRFSISGNKIIVKDGLLSPGSYNVYVKASSGMRTTKQAITITVAAADNSTAITESVFAGKQGQWFAVAYNAANSIPTLSEMKAATDGNKLYAYVKATSALSNNAVFYVSTSEETGFDMSHVWPDAGTVEYKVDMAGNVYSYVNGAWSSVGKADIYKTADAAEIAVNLSVLGNATGLIKVAVEEQGNSLLPNTGKNMYSVSTPIIATMPAITHDGDPSDWNGIQPIAEGQGTVGDLYAVHDDNYLYVMTRLSEVTDDTWASNTALSANLLINADGDSSTGYQHVNYPQGSGSDFLVQDWETIGGEELNGAAKSIEFFYTTETTATGSNIGFHPEYKKFSKVGDDENGPIYCVEYAVPIAAMKEHTNTVSDDMYIAIHRSNPSLQASTKPGSTVGESFAYVPKYNTSVAVKVGDKTFTDWNNVSRKVSNTSTDSTCNLFATKSTERLYTLVTNELGGLNTVNTYYLDTVAGGYTVSGYQGVDYIVKGGKLFSVTADNTLSKPLDDVWMSYYNDNVEMQLYLSQIGNPSTIKIAWRGVDGTFGIPANTNEYLTVTAEFNLQRASGYYYPVEDFATFTNPYKGWVSWAGEYSKAESEKYDAWEKGNFYYDYDTVYLAVRWSELQPNNDQDWELDAILDKYDVEEWVAAGKRINFRFVMDNPEELNGGNLKDRMDIPKWLYNELVEADIAAGGDGSGAGTFYHDADGSMELGEDVAGFSPNYYSEKMIERHDEIIRKLATYFDDTSITSFVQIGSIGHWGEFHTWPQGTGEWPDPATCAKYMEPYTKYFKNVKVGVRKPYPYAAANDYGLFNDIFGSAHTGTAEFYNYFTNGCTDMNGGATAEDIQNSKMPDFWKTNYSGGEFSNGQVRIHITNETSKDGSKGIMGTLDQIRYTHISWLGPCSPADLEIGEVATYVYETNVLAMQKLMGYNFALDKITKLGTISQNTGTAINMVWNNEGVAPFYYEWPIEFSLIDSNGNVAWTQLVDGDITNWMPGHTSVTVAISVPTSVNVGNYTLAIAIADKDTGEPGMKLAIEGVRDDGRYPLYPLTVSKKTASSGGNTGGSTGGSTSGGSTTGGSTSGTTDTTTGTTTDTTTGTTTGTTSTTTSTTTTTESTTTDNATDDTVTGDVTEEAEVPFEEIVSADEIETVEVQLDDLKSEIENAVASADADAEAGEEASVALEVKLDETTVVEPEVFETARGKNVDLVLTLANNCKWHINGRDIDEGALKAIDFEVILNTENIPEELTSPLKTESGFLQFEVKHNGNFGFKAGLTLPVGAEHVGKVATLFWHDTENGTMVPQGKNVVNANGNATFAFTHASDYIVILSEDIVEESTDVTEEVADVETDVTEETVTEDATMDDNEDSGNAAWIIILIVILVLAGGVFVALKMGLFKEGGKR